MVGFRTCGVHPGAHASGLSRSGPGARQPRPRRARPGEGLLGRCRDDGPLRRRRAWRRRLTLASADVALVASVRRSAAVIDTLRARGVPDAELARVRAPAGARRAGAQEEIALHALAEVVALRHERIVANPVAGRPLLCRVRGRPGVRHDRRHHRRHAHGDARGADVLLLLRGMPGAVRRRPRTVPRRHRRLSGRLAARRGSSSRRARRDGWASRSSCCRCMAGRSSKQVLRPRATRISMTSWSCSARTPTRSALRSARTRTRSSSTPTTRRG